MASVIPDRSSNFDKQSLLALSWAVVVGMAAAAVDYVIQSVRWPLMLDSPIMHYVVFLMQHGLKPYSQITDMNMPGAYLTEWFAMRIFGPSDLSWRIYEFVLLGILAAAMCVAAGRRSWIAGIFGAGVFVAMHAAEGPRQAVERDEVIAVLVMLSYAALFTSIRKQKPGWMSVVGLAGGLAASIKPTFLPLAVFMLVMACWQARGRQLAVYTYMVWGLAGLTTTASLVVGFILHLGVARNLFFIVHTVIPVYLGKSRGLFIAVRVIPKFMLPILPFAIAAAIANYKQGLRWNWERWSLAAGVLFGLISYFVQGSGIVYHRYEYLVCLLLLIGMEVVDSARAAGPWRWAGIGGVAVTMLFVVPIYTWNLHRVVAHSDFTQALEADLLTLGGAHDLQDKVQCLDMTTGCLNALYHLGIVENAGYTGDMLLFTRQQNAATIYYHRIYWQRMRDDPATVIVLSNQDMEESEGFYRLDNWAWFSNYLRENYTEVIARDFPHEGLAASAPPVALGEAAAYKIYIRNHTPLLQAGRRLGQ